MEETDRTRRYAKQENEGAYFVQMFFEEMRLMTLFGYAASYISRKMWRAHSRDLRHLFEVKQLKKAWKN